MNSSATAAGGGATEDHGRAAPEDGEEGDAGDDDTDGNLR